MPARPIIIVKKKSNHGGHHGGAWKVAYADFVTAMMALFIVLWLLNSSPKIQLAVGGYFRDPSGTAEKVGTTLAGVGENLQLNKQDMGKLKEELQKSIQIDPSDPEPYIKLAALYEKAGRKQESRDTLRAYLQFMPQNMAFRRRLGE